VHFHMNLFAYSDIQKPQCITWPVMMRNSVYVVTQIAAWTDLSEVIWNLPLPFIGTDNRISTACTFMEN
jgi:hypothetical protein